MDDKILNIDTVADYDEYWGLETRHPLVNVLEGSQITHPIPNCRKNYGLYVIFLKDVKCADYLKYGRNEYDFQENTLVFVSPGQVFGYPADGSTYKAKGWCLYFSPELLHGTGPRSAHQGLFFLFIRCQRSPASVAARARYNH